MAKLAGGEELAEPPTTVCPSCGAILAADQKTCPDCGVVKDKPALGALYRLVGFRQAAHKWMILLGFALMVASTSAASGAAVSDDAVDRQRAGTGRTNSPERRPFIWFGCFLLGVRRRFACWPGCWPGGGPMSWPG